jgi:DNA adenine methylase
MDLILAYKVIQADPEKLIGLLRDHEQANSSEYFYKIRGRHELSDPLEIASRILYLNKTCFNGLWRVNKKGRFNAPYGNNQNPNIVQADNIRSCHSALNGVTIRYGSYDGINPSEGDFVYFDPPYHPTSDGSFTSYAKSGFSEKNQAELAEFATTLHKRGVKVMLSNSNTGFIRELFKAKFFNVDVVDAPRLVNCKPGGRGAVEEVIITNY